MGSKMYLDEKVRQAHYQDLLREAEKRRLMAQLPWHRRSISRHAAGKLGVLLLKLGTRLKQFEQSPTMLDDHRGKHEPLFPAPIPVRDTSRALERNVLHQ